MNGETDGSYGQPWLPPEYAQWLAWAFDYDELHVRQKVLAISQTYYVTDAQDTPRFFVVRPPRLAVTMAVGFLLSLVNLAILISVVNYVMTAGLQALPVGLGVMIVSGYVLGIVGLLLAPYRHIEVFSDESRAWRILTITQDNKIGLTRDYTLYDCLGGEVARFRRGTLRSVLRRDWRLEAPDGTLLGHVREDSWPRALLRRYLGPLYGLLRTNFNFYNADGEWVGKYDRKLTLLDMYVLDMNGDPDRTIDRRVTLAMAILLDTGETR